MHLKNEKFVFKIENLIIQRITTMRRKTNIEIKFHKSVLNLSSACCKTHTSSSRHRTDWTNLRHVPPLCLQCCVQMLTVPQMFNLTQIRWKCRTLTHVVALSTGRVRSHFVPQRLSDIKMGSKERSTVVRRLYSCSVVMPSHQWQ